VAVRPATSCATCVVPPRRSDVALRRRRLNPSFNRSPPYQILLTTLGFVSVLACSSPQQTTPIVTVPQDAPPPKGLSQQPSDDAGVSRSSRRVWTWETNARDARERARRERLPLLVYVRADWSAGALAMDRDVWSDPRILFHPLALVPLRLDVTDGADAELWAEEFRVQALPTTILVGADGREVMRFDGVRSIDDVLSALRQLRDDTEDR
jgi:thiol:disulfide interchange protein